MERDNGRIRKIQLKVLEILKVYQDICDRHNLRYFAICGTCLGAVRHKGFIAWDDDMDIAMPYDDYVKFLELCKTELPERYGLLDPNEVKHTEFYFFSKIYDKTTTLIEKCALRYKDRYIGVFIDIYCVTGAPKSERDMKRITFYSTLLRKGNTKLRYGLDYVSSLSGFILWVMCLPLKLFVPFNYFSFKEEKMMSKYPFGSSDEVIFTWRGSKPNEKGWYRNVFPYEYFRDTIELPFEDTRIRVPVGYDRYLAMEFGDYMKLPPEEDRVNHGDGAIVDLERPYTYYAQR